MGDLFYKMIGYVFLVGSLIGAVVVSVIGLLFWFFS